MACGTPVISANCHSGPAEILNNGELGDLVPTADAAALCEAIRKNVTDPDSSRIRAARALAAVKTEFSIAGAVAKLQNILIEAAASRR
jgi:glycosyltransferase involved in cell wall biosynthesis